MIIIIIGLTSILFYQNNTHKNALLENQLVPVIQALKEASDLQKVDKLVADLLQANPTKNLVELHNELMATNQQLLENESVNTLVFKQWLNENTLATDVISRLQDSRTRNQQLRQSAIIQLQLMLFSIQSIIDEQTINHKSLYEQMERDQEKIGVTYSRTSSYVKSIQKLYDLERLKALLVDVLSSFELLTMHTEMTIVEQLIKQVEQVFILQAHIMIEEPTKALVDVNQQFDEFEKIVLIGHKVLEKWQGYIRLAQDYKAKMEAQQQQVKQILLSPYQYTRMASKSVIDVYLDKYNIELSDKNIIFTLLIAICLSLLIFFYLLWQIRKKIKISMEQGVDIIESVMKSPEKVVVPNCIEIQKIMGQILKINHAHHHDETLLVNQRLLEKQEKNIAELTQYKEQQALRAKAKINTQLTDQIQGYHLLEKTVVRIIQQYQVNCLNHTKVKKQDRSQIQQLLFLYKQLTQFKLALEMKSDKSLLRLSDINLIDEIHATLFNKKLEQKKYDNHLFISYDEQLLNTAKIDVRVFNQLINLFIDVALIHCRSSQVLLQVQLLDRSPGHQLVNFSLMVHTRLSETLQDFIMQLVGTQSESSAASPLIDAFKVLFAKLHGANIEAKFVDDSYQLSFELPLAIATPKLITNKISLEKANIMLLSSNAILAGLIENSVLSANGRCERLARIDSFKSQFTETHLMRHKFNILVVTSDIAVTHLELITQRITRLPQRIQPKLMLLQSCEFSYEKFGFYTQAEQLFCKETFLKNIVKLLESKCLSNELLSKNYFANKQMMVNDLPLLFGVKSPQLHQNLLRLLCWLGFHVQIVANEFEQSMLWKTGVFSLLVTEFTESALIEMNNKPNVDVGVLTLTDIIPDTNNSEHFKNWHIGKLNITQNNTLTELYKVFAPWLKPQVEDVKLQTFNQSINTTLPALPSQLFEDVVITEVAQVFLDKTKEVAFDFSQYLHNQGTAELALFMLDDYTKDNHQQLDLLIESIKEKDIQKAKESILVLTLNAKILSASNLQALCVKWSKLLSGTEIPNSLEKVNALLKDTRVALRDIDKYVTEL